MATRAILGVALLACINAGSAAPYIIPVTTPRDVGFDRYNRLYVTQLTGGVMRIDPKTQTVLPFLVLPGAEALGLAVDRSGCRLAITDTQASSNRVWVVDNIDNPAPRAVALPVERSVYGSFSTVWTGEDELFVTRRYRGSGWASLTKVNVATGAVTTLAGVSQDSMLDISDNGKVSIVEGNISSGPVSLRDAASGTQISTVNTGWFTYETSISPDGKALLVPTYGGGIVFDVDSDGDLQARPDLLGLYADYGPADAAFARYGSTVYVSQWAWSPSQHALYAYPDTSFTMPILLDTPPIAWSGNRAYGAGRLALSRDGQWLALALASEIRVYRVGEYSGHPIDLMSADFESCP